MLLQHLSLSSVPPFADLYTCYRLLFSPFSQFSHKIMTLSDVCFQIFKFILYHSFFQNILITHVGCSGDFFLNFSVKPHDWEDKKPRNHPLLLLFMWTEKIRNQETIRYFYILRWLRLDTLFPSGPVKYFKHSRSNLSFQRGWQEGIQFQVWKSTLMSAGTFLFVVY